MVDQGIRKWLHSFFIRDIVGLPSLCPDKRVHEGNPRRPTYGFSAKHQNGFLIALLLIATGNVLFFGRFYAEDESHRGAEIRVSTFIASGDSRRRHPLGELVPPGQE